MNEIALMTCRIESSTSANEMTSFHLTFLARWEEDNSSYQIEKLLLRKLCHLEGESLGKPG